jgi:nucleoside-diphosphate-sugar epimerase
MSSSVLVADGNNSTTSERNRVLIFGAAGAIGKKLTKALTEKYGPGEISTSVKHSNS